MYSRVMIVLQSTTEERCRRNSKHLIPACNHYFTYHCTVAPAQGSQCHIATLDVPVLQEDQIDCAAVDHQVEFSLHVSYTILTSCTFHATWEIYIKWTDSNPKYLLADVDGDEQHTKRSTEPEPACLCHTILATLALKFDGLLAANTVVIPVILNPSSQWATGADDYGPSNPRTGHCVRDSSTGYVPCSRTSLPFDATLFL